VLGVGSIIAVAVILAVTAIGIVLTHWIAPNHAQIVARRAAIPPSPRLQSDPHADLQGLRAQKQALLSGWAWVDSTHEFARIPIDRAMALYAQQQAATHGTKAPARAAPR
jgi:hypothetical protein